MTACRNQVPAFRQPAELLHAAKIDADAIVEAVKSLLQLDESESRP